MPPLDALPAGGTIAGSDFASMVTLPTADARGRLRQLQGRLHPGHAWIGAL
jgi:hypothetical protein